MAYDLLLERFLRYVKINTRSDENATRTPTTQSHIKGTSVQNRKNKVMQIANAPVIRI